MDGFGNAANVDESENDNLDDIYENYNLDDNQEDNQDDIYENVVKEK